MANVSLPDNMYCNPFCKPNDNDEQRKKMIMVVKAVIETQLTDMQRKAILMHYDNKSIAEISNHLGISKMSTYRKIKSSKKIIEKFKKIFEIVTL
jgi:predicted DNA-binding protein YlxM (UPF0122 family)